MDWELLKKACLVEWKTVGRFDSYHWRSHRNHHRRWAFKWLALLRLADLERQLLPLVGVETEPWHQRDGIFLLSKNHLLQLLPSMSKKHILNWQNVPMEDSKTSILVLNNLLAAEIAPEDISHPCHGFSSGPPMAVFFTLLTRCIVPESNETSQSKWCGWTMLGMNMDSWKTILTISSTLIVSALIFSPATRSNVSTFCAGTVLQICELWHDQWNWLFKENAFFVGNTNIQKNSYLRMSDLIAEDPFSLIVHLSGKKAKALCHYFRWYQRMKCG